MSCFASRARATEGGTWKGEILFPYETKSRLMARREIVDLDSQPLAPALFPTAYSAAALASGRR
jgi:hypothetical protein